MIGRGVFYNPLLPQQIKEGWEEVNSKDSERFSLFINDLIHELRLYKSETQTVNKMKDLWSLFSYGFEERISVFNQIIHVDNLHDMMRTINTIIETEKRLLAK